MVSESKLAYLNALETKENYESNVEDGGKNDMGRKKYFITFPYPYMNGKLHLGHIYSISKADFMAYYKRLCGYNVLFPFSFHCTGMPISASANKLKEELQGHPVDQSVAKILHQLGFADVSPFVDPIHWVRTFPKLAHETMRDFHAMIDWRRTFITTSLNKYYDSFIKFQFGILRAKKLLAFGKRYSIFCPIDMQACLDHDRRKGEGVKPIEAVLLKIVGCDGIIVLVRCILPETTIRTPSKDVERVVIGTLTVLKKFKIGSRSFITEDEVYRNLKWQVEGVSDVSDVSIDEFQAILGKLDVFVVEGNVLKLHLAKNGIYSSKSKNTSVDKLSDRNGLNSGGNTARVTNNLIDRIDQCHIEKGNHNSISFKLSEYEEILKIRNEELKLIEYGDFVKFYEPEDLVVSRSGGVCVVSLLDQWYIDYANEDWKENVRRCVARMEMTEATRLKIEESVEWINKWGFSRSFGLGTSVPWDEQYLIDSLSDSTIYMSFYTFKHLLYKDIEGKEEIFPSDLLCDEMWAYIYGGVMTEGSDTIPPILEKYRDVLEECRRSLEYYYPVDLRLSGKDLIGNHLTFYIFNHVALFREEFWPRRIFTNGHLMLNSAKMSKSEGNFLLAEEAIRKFGTSATRMCLATCGDTNEDANFEEENANAFILKLYSLAKNIEALSGTENKTEDIDIIENGNSTHNNKSTDNSTTKATGSNSIASESSTNNTNSTIKATDSNSTTKATGSNSTIKTTDSNNTIKTTDSNNTIKTTDSNNTTKATGSNTTKVTDSNSTTKATGSNSTSITDDVNATIKSDFEKFIDGMLVQYISYNVNHVIPAYEAMCYRDVVKYGFYENLHAIEQYLKQGGANKTLINYAYKTVLQSIYPIVPSFCAPLIRSKFESNFIVPQALTTETDKIEAMDYVRAIINRLVTGANGRKNCTITVSREFPRWKLDSMAAVGEIVRSNPAETDVKVLKREIIAKLSTVFKVHKISIDKGLKFAMDYYKNSSKYTIVFDEWKILTLMRKYIEKNTNINIKLEIGHNGEPMKPTIFFIDK